MGADGLILFRCVNPKHRGDAAGGLVTLRGDDCAYCSEPRIVEGHQWEAVPGGARYDEMIRRDVPSRGNRGSLKA